MEAFDIGCARYDVAIKAIFLLWRRAKWTLLSELFFGISRAEIDRHFQAFDEEIDTREIKTEAQCFKLVRTFPRIMDAAVLLVGLYQLLYMPVSEVEGER